MLTNADIRGFVANMSEMQKPGETPGPQPDPAVDPPNQAQVQAKKPEAKVPEIGGPSGPEPTRYGDWERKGICVDF